MPHDIIITDDSRVARAMIKKSMPDGDFVIREAGGGAECLALYREKAADMVFLDLTMPEMDGFETLERLRAMAPEAKVVVITADVQPVAKERVRALGALDVLHKPPKTEDLEEVLKKALV